jgi:hypothetical protein
MVRPGRCVRRATHPRMAMGQPVDATCGRNNTGGRRSLPLARDDKDVSSRDITSGGEEQNFRVLGVGLRVLTVQGELRGRSAGRDLVEDGDRHGWSRHHRRRRGRNLRV